MGWRVYWKLCQKYGVSRTDVWYKEVPDEVRLSEDENVETCMVGQRCQSNTEIGA